MIKKVDEAFAFIFYVTWLETSFVYLDEKDLYLKLQQAYINFF